MSVSTPASSPSLTAQSSGSLSNSSSSSATVLTSSSNSGSGKKESSGGGAKGAQSAQYGQILLRNQLKELMKNPVDGFSVGLKDDSNLYEWQIMLEGPPGTDFEGGYFPCSLIFPKEYPNKPPVMKFLTPGFFHPNVYKDGVVCISILHEAKENKLNEQEQMSEKWRPILGVEAVLVSVMSMLSEPNLDSPANVDASVMLKKDPKAYKKVVKALVRKSQDAL